MKKLLFLIIIIVILSATAVSAADTVTVLRPSLELQMIKQEQLNKKNAFAARRLAIQANKKKNIKNTTSPTKKELTPSKLNLLGNNETERQQYLLSHYAAPDFQDWQLWINISLAAKIDPSFMMCVGFAENTLGNHLKTAYNIGNVGNTDDGSVRSFSSPTEGLTWMAATFNNRYLGKYTKVSQLSRWGNPDGIIYATSPYNWHNNTIGCLSVLKGQQVSNDYAFRLP